jgi:hypothetical protein
MTFFFSLNESHSSKKGEIITSTALSNWYFGMSLFSFSRLMANDSDCSSVFIVMHSPDVLQDCPGTVKHTRATNAVASREF